MEKKDIMRYYIQWNLPFIFQPHKMVSHFNFKILQSWFVSENYTSLAFRLLDRARILDRTESAARQQKVRNREQTNTGKLEFSSSSFRPARLSFSSLFSPSRFHSRTRLWYELSSHFLPPAFISTSPRRQERRWQREEGGRTSKTKFLSEKVESSRSRNEETGIKQYRVLSLRKVECDSPCPPFVPRRARPGGPEIIVPEFQSPPRAHHSVHWSVQLLSSFSSHTITDISFLLNVGTYLS